MLHDGQTEPRAADGLGAALVHAVKPLENAALAVLRDADAGVAHGENDGAVLRRDGDIDAPAGAVVLDGVVAEIVNDAVEKLRYALHRRAHALERERHVGARGLRLQTVHGVFRDAEKIAGLEHIFLTARVEPGEINDILDELRHAAGLGADLSGEGLYVLRLRKAAFEQLRISGDGVQRRFQLMGNIRRELLPDERGALDLGAVAPELRLLRGNAPQKRLDLAVLVPFIILHRVVRVNGVDGRDNLFCQPRGEQEREHEREQRHKADRLREPKHERPERELHDRETEHRPVRQPLRGVKLAVGERRGVTARLARAGLKRLADLLALEMVFHARGVRLGVEEHRAVRADPGDAVIVGRKAGKVVLAAERHALRGERRFRVQLLHLHAGKVVIRYAHDKDERREKHRERRAPDSGEDFPAHFAPSIL